MSRLNTKAKFSLAAYIGGWLLIAVPLLAIWWGLATVWIGLGLLLSGGIVPLWTIVKEGGANNPPTDWFKHPDTHENL